MTTAETPNVDRRPLEPHEGLRQGGREALDAMIPTVYRELREIAHRHLSMRRPGDTLSTTALVNEAYLKLVGGQQSSWNDRVHFLAIAAVAMRHILTDQAKAHARLKRGGNAGARSVTLDETVISIDDQPGAVIEINDGLDRLAAIDARLARVVEYRFFGGLSSEEIAAVLGITERTVERDWLKARMLLREVLAA